jgi:hypothetical protein
MRSESLANSLRAAEVEASAAKMQDLREEHVRVTEAERRARDETSAATQT